MLQRLSERLSPAVKYWIFLVGISSTILAVIFGCFAASYLSLEPADRATVAAIFPRLLIFPFIGSLLLVAIIGGLVSWLFQSYVIPILRMAEQTRLITIANPDYRISTGGAQELVRLAAIINESADAAQRLQREVDARIAATSLALRQEHNRFAALLSELPSGVLVCNGEGQILLYNRKAQELLDRGDVAGSSGRVGLGRSLFGFLDREPIAQALLIMRHDLAAGHPRPLLGVMTKLCGERTIRVSMAPADPEDDRGGTAGGFVLSLEDIGGEFDAASRGPLGEAPLPPLDIQPRTPPRPLYYAFDLFHQPGQQALGHIPLRQLTYVVFDTETTGLDPAGGDEIIQIGGVRIVGGRLRSEEVFDQLVNPRRPVPAGSVQIHGIAPELLVTQPPIGEVLPRFHGFARESVLVAHNAAFDMKMLQVKEELLGLRFDQPVLDTLLLSTVVHPHQEGHSLEAIATRLNVSIVGRHTALGDALATAEVFLKLIPLLEAQGIVTLNDALAASAKSPYAKLKF